MNTQQITAVSAITGGIAGGFKLVAIGAFLAIGFSVGNTVVRKTVDAYEGWRYSRLEKKSPPPEEKEDANTS